ncbi:conserved hypothetical protein [uncultured Alphaproteobacteria bacterium]|uniref:Dinitrogenase iron-molybdenum cofactor biosynthesis domain-containing protein n=1 Tax=uncultured Alphaproteobacteria bacterium TaxID=91750 RepID=A0A212K1H1_9PROT|nr:conserved hypothetical protein [uncultured Alphaproteobacteria bacterium]
MMELVAVPSDLPGGLEAPVSEHFGHCEAFTLVALAEGRVASVAVLPNAGHGDCSGPVQLLAERGVTRVVAAGIGANPLAAFAAAGIPVSGVSGAVAVGDAIAGVIAGEIRPLGSTCTCGGH